MQNCNVGLGHLGDSIEGLERALQYLKKADGRSDEGVAEEAVGGQRISERSSIVQGSSGARVKCTDKGCGDLAQGSGEYIPPAAA